MPVAAVAVAALMAGAAAVHLRRGDGIAGAAPAAVLLIVAAAIAVLRFGPYAF